MVAKGDTAAAADKPTAPGPKVVEALANSMAASFLNIACQESAAARRRELTTDGRDLDPTEALKLRALESLGAQLVTATTPVGGAV